MAIFERRTSKDGILKYRAKVRIRGYPAQSKTFFRLADAKNWAMKVELKIQEGTYFSSARAHKSTLGELIDRFLAEILPKKSEAMNVSQGHQLLWWKKQLGAYLISHITPGLIIEQRSKLEKGRVKGGKLRSPATCNRYVAALRHAFSIAVRDWEWTQDNPAKRVVKLAESRGRNRFLDNHEQYRLLVACKQSKSPYLYLVVLIALSTGMRLTEILSLTWNQINFSEGTILIFITKNKRPRKVPIQGEALRKLKEHSKIRRIDTNLVFPRANDANKYADIRDGWDYAIMKAEIKDFRFHDLRHTAASYYAMSGASARDLCEIFGWETMQMAMRYAHLFDSHTGELAVKMNDRFLNIERDFTVLETGM